MVAVATEPNRLWDLPAREYTTTYSNSQRHNTTVEMFYTK